MLRSESACAAGLIAMSADQYHTLALTPFGRDGATNALVPAAESLYRKRLAADSGACAFSTSLFMPRATLRRLAAAWHRNTWRHGCCFAEHRALMPRLRFIKLRPWVKRKSTSSVRWPALSRTSRILRSWAPCVEAKPVAGKRRTRRLACPPDLSAEARKAQSGSTRTCQTSGGVPTGIRDKVETRFTGVAA